MNCCRKNWIDERQIRQLEIEREAIKREKDEKKLKELNTEIANLNEERELKANGTGKRSG